MFLNDAELSEHTHDTSWPRSGLLSRSRQHPAVMLYEGAEATWGVGSACGLSMLTE